MSNKIITGFCKLLAGVMLFLMNNRVEAQGKADSLPKNRQAVTDWYSQLTLSEQQQTQLKEMEQAFQQKMTVMKQDTRTGKEKSAALREVYVWRDVEISKILTADQLKKYREKQDNMRKKGESNLERIKAGNKKQTNLSNK
jgi:hypothetical protein